MSKPGHLSDLPPPRRNKSGWPWNVEPATLPPTMPNGQMWPLISIVTPTYNQGEFIEEAIRSVLLQGYPNLEYIIIDGGSTDQTLSIIEKYQPWIDYWVSEVDEGQSAAINKGFARSTGDILNWLNSDDYLERDALAHVAPAFAAADETVGAVVGRGWSIDMHKQLIRSRLPDAVSRDTLFRWPWGEYFLQPACFFSKAAWAMSGPLPMNLHYSMDLALWLKISEKFRFSLLPHTIAYAYLQPNAKTVANYPRSKAEVALLYASLPDGFDRATAVMEDLFTHQLIVRAAPGNNVLRNLARRMGLGRLRHALRRLIKPASYVRG